MNKYSMVFLFLSLPIAAMQREESFKDEAIKSAVLGFSAGCLLAVRDVANNTGINESGFTQTAATTLLAVPSLLNPNRRLLNTLIFGSSELIGYFSAFAFYSTLETEIEIGPDYGRPWGGDY